MNAHHKFNYIEFQVSDHDASKKFFSSVFGWTYQDYGADYTAFFGAGLDGGFYTGEKVSRVESGSALVIFYSEDLEATQQSVLDAGGSLIKEIFSFPGGRRFHFADPSGNEFAV